MEGQRGHSAQQKQQYDAIYDQMPDDDIKGMGEEQGDIGSMKYQSEDIIIQRQQQQQQQAAKNQEEIEGGQAQTGQGSGGLPNRQFMPFMNEDGTMGSGMASYPQQLAPGMRPLQQGGYLPYPPAPPQQIQQQAAFGGTGYEQSAHQSMAIKRPNSAVAARKNRGGSGATMMNNYSRGGNTDLSRTRPKKMLQDKQSLYDEARILKVQLNRIREQNLKLNTKIQIQENEISKKDKQLQDIITQQSGQNARSGKFKTDPQVHLISALKRQIKQLKGQVSMKDQEITSMKKNIKSTKIQQLQIQMKMYIDECTRLRHLLQQTMKARNPLTDPRELQHLEQKFRALNLENKKISKANRQLGQFLQQKEQYIMQLNKKLEVSEKQAKKKQGKESKDTIKLKKQLKQKERQNIKIKGQMAMYKSEFQESTGNTNQGQKLDKLTKEKAKLLNENTDLKNQVKDLREQLMQKNQDASSADKAVEDVRVMLQEKINQCEEYKRQVHSLNKQIDQLSQSKQNVQRELENQMKIQQRDQIQRPQSRQINAEENNRRIQPMRQAQKEEVKQQITLTPLVSPKQIQYGVMTLRLLCQLNSINSKSAPQYILGDYSQLPKVSIQSLQKDFEMMDMHKEDALILARYIIQPRKEKQIQFQKDRWIKLGDVNTKIKSLLGEYPVYSSKDCQSLNKKLRQKMGHLKISLRQAFDMNDQDQLGFISYEDVKETLEQVELQNLTQNEIDYMIFLMFHENRNIQELKYQAVIDIISSQEQGEEGDNKGQEEPSQVIDDYEDDGFQQENAGGGQMIGLIPEKQVVMEESRQNQMTSSDYGQQNDGMVESVPPVGPQNVRNIKNEENDHEQMQSKNKGEAYIQDDDEDEDNINNNDDKNMEEQQFQDPLDNLTEQQVMDYAEQGFYKLTGFLRKNKLTVRQFLTQVTNTQQIDEQETIEYIRPTDFIEVVRKNQIGLNQDYQLTCLLKVIMKAEFGGVILLQQLIQLLSKFGVPERYKGAFQMNYQDLDHKSVKYLTRLTQTLMQRSLSLYEFFKNYIYQQMVKTKSKQKNLDLINADDFFEILYKKGLKKSPKQHMNLMQFLCLDETYVDRIYIKKLGKAVAEFARNQQFRAIGHMKSKQLNQEGEDGTQQAASLNEQKKNKQDDKKTQYQEQVEVQQDKQASNDQENNRKEDKEMIQDQGSRRQVPSGGQSVGSSEHEYTQHRAAAQHAPPANRSQPCKKIDARGYQLKKEVNNVGDDDDSQGLKKLSQDEKQEQYDQDYEQIDYENDQNSKFNQQDGKQDSVASSRGKQETANEWNKCIKQFGDQTEKKSPDSPKIEKVDKLGYDYGFRDAEQSEKQDSIQSNYEEDDDLDEDVAAAVQTQEKVQSQEKEIYHGLDAPSQSTGGLVPAGQKLQSTQKVASDSVPDQQIEEDFDIEG